MSTSGSATTSNQTVPAPQYASGQSLPANLYGAGGVSITSAYNYTSHQSQLVVPFVAAMYADASGQVGVLQRENVTITGIDDVFDICCSVVNAVKILNAFSVRDEDQKGMLGLSAEVSVAFDASSNFLAALADIIADGDLNGAAKDAAGKALHAYMREETHADLLATLAHDQLANMLEASDLNVEIALDASSGATNMTSALAASSGNAPQYRKALFTQIPEYTVEQYLRVSNGSDASGVEDVSGIRFLPLLTGDVMAFVFDVTVGEYAMGSNAVPQHNANMQRVFRDANSVYPTGTANGGWNASNDVAFNADASGGYVNQAVAPYTNGGLTFVAPTKRRIALKVHLGDKDCATGKVFNLVDGLIRNGQLAATAPTVTNGSVVVNPLI